MATSASVSPLVGEHSTWVESSPAEEGGRER
jgi:hypothetical protein